MSNPWPRRLLFFFLHDGRKASFSETLKRGKPYHGYYAVPFQEIVAIFSGLREGKSSGGP